jgi:hypothetical protein
LHRKEKFLLFPDENYANSYEKLTKIDLSNSSAFHTNLQNFRQEKVEIFLFHAKAGFFVRFVKIVCTTLYANPAQKREPKKLLTLEITAENKFFNAILDWWRHLLLK